MLIAFYIEIAAAASQVGGKIPTEAVTVAKNGAVTGAKGRDDAVYTMAP